MAKSTSDGRNVVVLTAKGQKAVPSRVLQVGPGDYCRLAFQTVPGQTAYEVFYGGEPPAADTVPAWTNQDGLLLETRQFRSCNLNDFASVRAAFNAAKPIGADYVDAVQHSHNPMALTPGRVLQPLQRAVADLGRGEVRVRHVEPGLQFPV